MRTFSNIILLLAILGFFPHDCQACCNSCEHDSCCSSCCDTCRTVKCYHSCQKSCCQVPVEPIVITRTPATSTPGRLETDKTPSCTGSTSCTGTSNVSNIVNTNITSVNSINNVNTINLNISINNDVKNTESGDGKTETKTVTVVVPTIVTVPVPVTVPCPSCNETTPATTVRPCGGTCTTKPPTLPCGTCYGCKPCVPKPMPRPFPGCCVVVIPCVTPGCDPYHHRCRGCHGDVGFVPINPCWGGCQKRQYWDAYNCHGGECFTRRIDCSFCGRDFYTNYHSYSQCHGCFYGGYGGYGGY